MIEIKFDPKNLELKVEGHAGQDVKGKDIICSAVSMLFYTLAESLVRSEDMMKKHPIITMEDGNGYIKCRPKKEYKRNISIMYWTVLNGLELLADEYPQYITFEVGGQQ